jgi:hypothetical protein
MAVFAGFAVSTGDDLREALDRIHRYADAHQSEQLGPKRCARTEMLWSPGRSLSALATGPGDLKFWRVFAAASRR